MKNTGFSAQLSDAFCIFTGTGTSTEVRVPGTSPVAASTRRDVLAPQRLLGTEIGINPSTGAYPLVN